MAVDSYFHRYSFMAIRAYIDMACIAMDNKVIAYILTDYMLIMAMAYKHGLSVYGL